LLYTEQALMANNNRMSLINLKNYWQLIVKGLFLIVAVWVDTMSKKEISV